mmetsp:Transcript_24718/g.79815  ORF Transcript_24718/g.79815 Transcript_24718/m.79815 type:complete len:418 (+) Transcript_24718:66-1319(+)
MGGEKKEKKMKKLAEAGEDAVKKDKKEKKEKKKEKEVPVEPVAPVDEEAAKKAAKKAKKEAKTVVAAEGGEKEEKKEKKEKKRAAEEPAEAPAAKKGPAASPAAAPAAAASADGNDRCFIGNLPFSINDDQIKEVFASCGAITSIDWLTHADTGKFKGAGFLQFESAAAASAATALNGNDLDGRPMKIELAAPRKAAGNAGATGAANEPGEPSDAIFLGNLSWSIDEAAVRKAFEGCGTVTRVKFLEKDGQFMGKAFVDFDSVESATKAVALDGVDLAGRPARINFSKPREKKEGWESAGKSSAGKPQRTYKPQNPKPEGCVELFVGNLPWSIDEEKISAFFKPAGTVVATRWLNDRETQEFKGVGFITLETTEQVDKAVELAGEYLDGRQVRIDYAGKKKEGAWGGGGGGGGGKSW